MSRVRFAVQGAGGFTLVEVLVALAIVTFGMSALLATLSTSADTVVYLRDKTLSEWIALNRIAEIRLGKKPPENGKSSAQVEYAGRSWQVQQEVLELQLEGIRRIDVSVRPAQGAPKDGSGAWTTTVSGVLGAALAEPSTEPLDWPGSPTPGAGSGGGGETPTAPSPDVPAPNSPAPNAPAPSSPAPSPAPAPPTGG